jgi:hypothetical protein
MNLHLAEIAIAVAPGAHAVLLLAASGATTARPMPVLRLAAVPSLQVKDRPNVAAHRPYATVPLPGTTGLFNSKYASDLTEHYRLASPVCARIGRRCWEAVMRHPPIYEGRAIQQSRTARSASTAKDGSDAPT